MSAANETPRTDAMWRSLRFAMDSGDALKICESSRTLERELAAERAKREKAEAKYKIARTVLLDICAEWNEDCDPACDSYGHTETCKATNIANAKRALRERAESAEARLKEAREALEKVAFKPGDWLEIAHINYCRFCHYSRDWIAVNGHGETCVLAIATQDAL